MVPWKDLLSDAQIAAVLSFIRSEWGNKAPRVTPEQVKMIRDKTATRKQHWTAQELLQISPFE
jgi:mono/diheme cytochrome c family protein